MGTAVIDLALESFFFCVAYWLNPIPRHGLIPDTAAVLFIVYPVLSNILRKSGWIRAGFDMTVLSQAARICVIVGVPLAITLFLLGYGKPLRLYPAGFFLTIGPWRIRLSSAYQYALLYVPLALAQQYIFMGFVWDRWRLVLGGHDLRAAFLGWFMFVAMHIPNPVLMVSAFAGWWVFFSIFRRYRNILPIAILHAVLALLVYKATFPYLPSMLVGEMYTRNERHFDPTTRSIGFNLKAAPAR